MPLGSPVFHYKKAATLGDSFAMYKYGLTLIQGRLGMRQNVREGVLWLKRAAQPVASRSNSESPNALFELGQLYDGTSKMVQATDLQGIVIQDEAYAYTLYLRAAELGFPPAQHQLGTAYEHGHFGLPVDPRRSIQFYAMAAERSHPEAELALSGWYLTGAEGVVQQSDAQAYHWARKAAEKGLSKAEYAVGYYTENGVGVEADKAEALRWYNKAAAKGNKRAAVKAAALQGTVVAAADAPVASSGASGILGRLKSSPSRSGKPRAISFLSRSSSNTSLSTMGSK
jgi:TPR repeat protein